MFHLVGAHLGQLACSEMGGWLWSCGRATVNMCVQVDQGGQKLVLAVRHRKHDLLKQEHSF